MKRKENGKAQASSWKGSTSWGLLLCMQEDEAGQASGKEAHQEVLYLQFLYINGTIENQQKKCLVLHKIWVCTQHVESSFTPEQTRHLQRFPCHFVPSRPAWPDNLKSLTFPRCAEKLGP